ncbi:MAG: Gfo/Idh/MocA family oxidoreductase [Dehalococcoidia bacterium]|nr:Gfo/Idh/MocA family oxidoreductase [Dehalococcoidia bacterium]
MAYRVGIVGASGIVINTPRGEPSPPLDREISTSHVSGLSYMPEMELAAICDINPEALERFEAAWSERWPETRLYADYGEMLEREKLDILTVATSDHRHAQIVIDGAECGVRGIFCEKPIATTLEETDAMIAACERNGVKMSVNHSRRWFPLYHKVRQAIRSGAIGTPTVLTAVLGGPRAMMFRNGTHFIDALCFFAESEPVKVSAILEDGFDHWDRYRGDGGKLPENDPGMTGTVLFENGVRAIFRSLKGTAPISSLEITGPKGVIRMGGNDRGAELAVLEDVRGEPTRTMIYPEQYQVQGTVAAYRELVDIMEHGGESISSPQDARVALQILLGFLESHRQGGRLVDVPE